MTVIRGAALIGFALIASLLTACGSSDNGSVSGPASGKGNATDRTFVSQMVPHHKSAIEMANIAQRRGQSKFVKTLADNIVGTQQSEVGTVQAADQKLAGAGVKVGDLGVAMHAREWTWTRPCSRPRTTFDRAFIDMMVPHHQGAIRMARIELAKGQDTKVKAVARAILGGQSKEIGEMNAHRKMAFGAPYLPAACPPKARSA